MTGLPSPLDDDAWTSPLSDEVLGHTLAVHFRQCGLAAFATGIDFDKGVGVVWCGVCGEELVAFRLSIEGDDGEAPT